MRITSVSHVPLLESVEIEGKRRAALGTANIPRIARVPGA